MSHQLQLTAQKLFFIVGCGRSGTTLLRSMLDSHPSIKIPRETFFFNNIAKFEFDVSANEQVEKIVGKRRLELIASRWWIREMGISEDDLEQSLGEAPATWPNLFLALILSNVDIEANQRVGEKTVGHLGCCEQLLTAYPNADVLQIIRDPRGAFASFRKAKVGLNHVAPLVRDWQKAAEIDLRLTNHPRYFRLRFEDLIQTPEDQLKKICEHLGVDFSPTMLEFHNRKNAGFSDFQNHHQNTMKPIFTTSLKDWQQSLSRSQIALIEHCLSSHMKRIGYSPTGARVSGNRIRLAISSFADSFSKCFIRRPHAIITKIRANYRSSKSLKCHKT